MQMTQRSVNLFACQDYNLFEKYDFVLVKRY